MPVPTREMWPFSAFLCKECQFQPVKYYHSVHPHVNNACSNQGNVTIQFIFMSWMPVPTREMWPLSSSSCKECMFQPGKCDHSVHPKVQNTCYNQGNAIIQFILMLRMPVLTKEMWTSSSSSCKECLFKPGKCDHSVHLHGMNACSKQGNVTIQFILM